MKKFMSKKIWGHKRIWASRIWNKFLVEGICDPQCLGPNQCRPSKNWAKKVESKLGQ